MPPLPRSPGDGFADGFGLLARARGDRALHPRGEVFAATTTFVRAVDGVPALAGTPAVDSLLRLSRAIGLPRALPDVLGFALRLHDLHGPGAHQDLLLASSPPPGAHVVLAPRRRFAGAWFTSLLPYRLGAERSLLVVHAVAPGRFALGSAGPLSSDVRPLAEVEVRARLEPPPVEASSFDPILHASADLRQDAGPWDAIRARAYRRSRDGRTP